jgi:LPS-assembly protein
MMLMRRLLLGFLLLLPGALHAIEPAPERQSAPVVLNADQVTHDQNTDIATAIGNVEVTQGGRVLRADKIIYDKKRDVVTAWGNVALIEADGQVSFADKFEVSSDMKQGFVDEIGVLLTDNSRFAAQEGERVDGRYIILRRATYSACDLCKEDPEKPPLWQLKAAKVMHDNETKRITYRDAFLELAGLPVFYTPYFSHPDPSVKRKSGFLTPTGGSSSNIGSFATVPYYIDIAPDKDLTLSPTMSGKDGFQFAAEYRQRFRHGAMKFDGSAVIADRVNDQNVLQKDALRGHLFGDVAFDIGAAHRAGAKVAFTSDKSYLYRYRIPTSDVLENRAYFEYFRGRDYANIEGLFFQDLRPGERQVEPLALRASYSAVGAPNQTLGGRWDVEASLISLTRDSTEVSPLTRGPDSKRASLAFGWERQMVSDLGLVASIGGSVRGDLFFADRLQDPEDPNNFYSKAYSQRVLPVGNIVLRYPLGRQGEHWRQTIEPIVSLTASPNLARDPHIVNEDSQGTEFDITNLFATNRFSGVDRYETGVRATYGLRAAAYDEAGGSYGAMLGASTRLTENRDFPAISGLRDEQSDLVGYLRTNPVPWFGASYNFRLNKDSFQPRYSEFNGFIGEAWFRPTVQYLAVDGLDANNNQSTISEITYGFSTNFMPYWTFAAAQRRALKSDAGPRNTGASLTYRDECTTVGLSVNHDDVTRPDLSSGTTFMITVYLRNLGGLQSGGISTGAGGSRQTSQP